jgi:hypothetical protein
MRREKNHAGYFPFAISSDSTVVPGHRIVSFPASFKKLGTTLFLIKFGEKLGRNWEEKI